MELLPPEQMKFEKIKSIIEGSFRKFGFTPLDTPVIESSEVLLAKAGGETEKQIYRFTRGDTDLSLRFDLTVPLAKYVAAHAGELTFPFRRYQIGKVYRGERAQKGRFREFYQCDIDIVGDGELSVINEAEIPAVIYSTFSELGLAGFVIRMNNRKILSGLFEALGISGKSADVMRVIDKLDKIGADAVQKLLTEEEGLSADTARELIAIIQSNDTTALDSIAAKSETLAEGLSELNAVLTNLRAFGVPEENFRVDLTIARGLDYYTGTVYETTVTAHPEIGSVCSGGRYDNLAEYYTKRRLPGVGISIGLTRLFYTLNEYGMLSEELSTAPSFVTVIPMTEDFSHAIAAATEIRALGVPAAIDFEAKKVKAKLSAASKLGVPYVIFIGEDEIAQNGVTVRDMANGSQFTAGLAVVSRGLSDKYEEQLRQKPIK
jgi:histidyl-tRNA synthetase